MANITVSASNPILQIFSLFVIVLHENWSNTFGSIVGRRRCDHRPRANLPAQPDRLELSRRECIGIPLGMDLFDYCWVGNSAVGGQRGVDDLETVGIVGREKTAAATPKSQPQPTFGQSEIERD